MPDFRRSLHQLQQAVNSCTKGGIDPFQPQKQGLLADFKSQQIVAAHSSFNTAIKDVIAGAGKVEADIPTLHKLRKLTEGLSAARTIAECRTILDDLSTIAAKLDKPSNNHPTLDVFTIPADIRDEVSADLSELQKCFESGCYRSVTILCGRLLETALHRKYYEATGNDLLETAPGIGLGNLIAKLNEKNIALDPALSNQIHLINQVRVFSVHKKSTTFSPSKEQAQAIMLYTVDVFNRMFAR